MGRWYGMGHGMDMVWIFNSLVFLNLRDLSLRIFHQTFLFFESTILVKYPHCTYFHQVFSISICFILQKTSLLHIPKIDARDNKSRIWPPIATMTASRRKCKAPQAFLMQLPAMFSSGQCLLTEHFKTSALQFQMLQVLDLICLWMPSH